MKLTPIEISENADVKSDCLIYVQLSLKEFLDKLFI
jgi:hypothetical protein